MKIQFNIHYKTQWGQSMYLLIYKSTEQPENGSSEGIIMKCNEKSEWNTEISLDSADSISYQYAILNPDKSFDYEYGGIRKIELNPSKETVLIYDNWRASYGDSPFITAAFSDCFFNRTKSNDITHTTEGSLILRLNCPQMEPDRHFAIVGNQEVLGNWDVTHKVRLDESQFPIWSISLDVEKISFPLEYKYLIVDTKTDEVLVWGGGPNRIVQQAEKQSLTVVNDEHFIRTIPSWRGAGVAIPVFSLRSEKSFGIGEFNDLKKMVDWAKKTGQRIIQTLPINDTILYHTNYDSYPYNAVSVYALHPIYLNLDSLGKLKTKKQKDYFLAKKQELNAQTFSDYQHVMNTKWEFFKIIYPQESPAVLHQKTIKHFLKPIKNGWFPMQHSLTCGICTVRQNLVNGLPTTSIIQQKSRPCHHLIRLIIMTLLSFISCNIICINNWWRYTIMRVPTGLQ